MFQLAADIRHVHAQDLRVLRRAPFAILIPLIPAAALLPLPAGFLPRAPRQIRPFDRWISGLFHRKTTPHAAAEFPRKRTLNQDKKTPEFFY